MGDKAKPVTQKVFRLESVKERYVRLSDVWSTQLNGELTDSLGTQSTKQVFLKRICNTHFSFQSLRSFLNTSSMAWYNCKICKHYQCRNKRTPPASKIETAVFRLINQELGLQDEEWITDSKPVCDGSNVGSADIYIPSRKCVIQIDGSSHFVRKYDISQCKQRQIDERFNVAALRKFHVIRLHENDISTLGQCWTDVLVRQPEMALMHENEDHHVLIYSRSYYKLRLVDDDLREDLECKQYD